MSFGISPGVNVQENDQSSIIPAVATSTAALAGVFTWGPAFQPVLIGTEGQLRSTFSSPVTGFNTETWFSGSSFLAYSTSLWVNRAVDANTFNAVAATVATANVQINNATAYSAASSFPANSLYIAKYPGSRGNSLAIAVCDSAVAYSSTTAAPVNANNTVSFTFQPGQVAGTFTVTNSAGATGNTFALSDASAILGGLATGDWVNIGNTTTGTQLAQISVVGSPVLSGNGVATATISLANTLYIYANAVSTSLTRKWQYYSYVSSAPGTSDYVASQGGSGDELHVVIIDALGKFKGTPGAILEVYSSVSRGTDAKDSSGNSNYYKNVINTNSAYAWWSGDRAGAVSAVSSAIQPVATDAPLLISFTQGTDSANEGSISLGAMQQAYSAYQNAENIDVSLVICGRADTQALPNYIIDNICETRKDCIALVSPPRAAVVNNVGGEALAIVAARNAMSSSSYAVMDSGYKYMWDQYNNQYVWVPLNGDIAGLCARTDQTNDPWFSPAGYTRGQIKNVIKLAYNPSKTDRDLLYPLNVNPVVSFPGQGTILYGDKTLQAKPSAFDRINVRRLFIVIEKAIAIAAKYQLFEFNNPTTQQNFVNMTVPYLREVQGRQGVQSFMVVCNASNNPPEVVASNQFVGSIFVVPSYSINFINLVFTAENGEVAFTESTGSNVS